MLKSSSPCSGALTKKYPEAGSIRSDKAARLYPGIRETGEPVSAEKEQPSGSWHLTARVSLPRRARRLRRGHSSTVLDTDYDNTSGSVREHNQALENALLG